jgi:hypothetical protein
LGRICANITVFKLRLYYISNDSYLRELYADFRNPDDPITWKKGSLNNQNFSADPETALCSLVQVGGVNQLKIYYKVKGAELFNCAYAIVGSTAWSVRECFNKGGD